MPTKDIARDYELGDINQLPVMGGQIIYEGSAVGAHPSGYIKRLESGHTFVGFAEEHVDNSTGLDGAKTVRVKKRGAVFLNIPFVTLADINKPIFFNGEDDSFTFDGNAYYYVFVGRISRVEANGMVLIEFGPGTSPY